MEPIPLEVKAGRGGLGRDAVIREVRERKREAIRRMVDRRGKKGEAELSTEQFRRGSFCDFGNGKGLPFWGS